jgi:uncharacterized protein YgbK (DUF1537 family)
MDQSRCLVVADDMTGGGDTGAQFAQKGLRTLLVTPGISAGLPADYLTWDVLVLNTHSRAMDAAQARQAVTAILQRLELKRFGVIYKKIDSTFRGNIGGEVDVILETCGLPVGFLTPAFPEMGRTVKDGVLMVQGTPVAETEVSRDPACPVKDSNLVNLLRRQSSGGIDLVDHRRLASALGSLRDAVDRKRQAGAKILVFDSLGRKDLEVIAEVGFGLQPLPLFIGSAGLAEAVANRFAEKIRLTPAAPSTTTSAAHALVVCGSASAVSRRQLAQVVQKTGFPHIEIRSSFALQAPSERAAEERAVRRKACDALRRGSVILSVSPERTADPGIDDRLTAQAITEALGGIAAHALAASGVAPKDVALILTGGDTAMAVLAPLGIEGIEIGGELLAGIMAGRVKGGRFSDAQVVTKAGAFGQDDALLQIVKRLTRVATQADRLKAEG